MSTTGNKLMDDLTNAFSEAAKRNADAVKQGFDIWRETMNLPFNISRIVSEGSSTLSKGFADYLRLNVEYASHLLDLSREMSKELLASLERSGWQTNASATGQTQQGQTVSELHLKGSPGDLCRSAFILESKKSRSVHARVFHSRFINLDNNSPVTIPVIIDPVEVIVAPEDKVRISLEAGIPENIPYGTYQSMFWIEGFPELSLKLILDVVESYKTQEPVKSTKTATRKIKKTIVKPKKPPEV